MALTNSTMNKMKKLETIKTIVNIKIYSSFLLCFLVSLLHIFICLSPECVIAMNDHWRILFECSQEGYHTYRGGFWNYFSMGKKSNVFLCRTCKTVQKNNVNMYVRENF